MSQKPNEAAINIAVEHFGAALKNHHVRHDEAILEMSDFAARFEILAQAGHSAQEAAKEAARNITAAHKLKPSDVKSISEEVSAYYEKPKAPQQAHHEPVDLVPAHLGATAKQASLHSAPSPIISTPHVSHAPVAQATGYTAPGQVHIDPYDPSNVTAAARAAEKVALAVVTEAHEGHGLKGIKATSTKVALNR